MLHLANTTVWTGHDTADSITIDGDRVVAIGAAPTGRIVDLRDAWVGPGFVDAHLHLLLGGEMLEQVDLTGVTSRAMFEAAIAAAHAELPPNRWLVARGWSEERWGGTRPDRHWLRAAADRPVVAHRVDIHAAVVNDAVIDLCDTDRPLTGGVVERDADGRPTGMMVEAAAWELVNPLIPSPDAATRRAWLLSAQRHCHARGLTAVGSMEYRKNVESALVPCRDALTLRIRVTLLDRAWPLDLDFATSFAGDERLAVIGSKTFLDGTLGSRTAWMLEDYADAPGRRGAPLEFAASGDLMAWMEAVIAAGLSPSMHSIGDAATRLALDAIETLDAASHVRLEHAQQIDPADVMRCRDVVLSMQPAHLIDDGDILDRRLGAARRRGAFAFRDLAAAGARLAFGSDWPVVDADPIEGMRAAITSLTRSGVVFRPDQCLEPAAALHAWTVGAADTLRLQDGGRLRVGGPADLVVLDRDPLHADWISAPPRVIGTVARGQVVYDQLGRLVV